MARSTRRGRTSSWGSNSSSTSSGHKEQQQPQAAASMPLTSSASSTTSALADANNGTTFPKKLAEMLGNETQSVTWSSHGLSFFICDQHDLTYTLLPKYFRHNKLTSFQRQLNLYGFRRITKGIDTGAYFHPQFRRDRPDLVPKIRRLPGQGATATAKFLPLYYKDVQNSSPKGSGSATSAVTAAAAAASAAMTFSSLPSPGRRRSNSSTSNSRRRRRFRSESIASTLSHASSSECSSVYVESCDGDDVLGDMGDMGEVGGVGAGPCTGSATGSSNTSSNNSYMGGQDYEDDEPEFTFMDPPPLSVVTSNESDLSMVSEDGSIDSGSSNNSVNVPFASNGEDMVGYGYGASAPAPKLPSFQQYWQPSFVSTGTGTGSTTATKAMTTTAAAAAATTTTTIHTEAASSLPPLSGSLAAPPTIRFFTTTSSIPAEREHHHQPHAMRNSSSALRPPSTSSSPLPATFSANSFSLWLNGAPLPHQQQQQPQHHQQPQQQVHHHTTGGNQQQQQQQRQAQLDGPLALATDASAAVAMSAPSASGPMSPPPPPKPLLVKRCSSINSELWRGWGSSEDLQALVEMETSIDEIFGSFGPETETVLQSVGLEITSDGSLRPDPSVAVSLSLGGGSSTTTPATAGAAESGLVAFSGITAA